ncbi:hypothetical protein [Methylorubrum sp. SB2]|uniref:hypothetical protein n=1 Tax=Methylorubrum subtropicum TaxID=3138812 RepID=UPI00313C7940
MDALPSTMPGRWTYRSYRNTFDLVNGEAEKALRLIFGEGTFLLEESAGGGLQGTLDMGGGYVLDLSGTVSTDETAAFSLVGLGRPGSATAGWQYDYRGQRAPTWPNGVDQVPALLGSVIRAKPHDGAPAGVTASFIAVRQP